MLWDIEQSKNRNNILWMISLAVIVFTATIVYGTSVLGSVSKVWLAVLVLLTSPGTVKCSGTIRDLKVLGRLGYLQKLGMLLRLAL